MLLREFIDRISSIFLITQESLCLSVLDKVQGLPIISKNPLEKTHEIFIEELRKLDWEDLERWILSWIDHYQNRLEDLANASGQAHNFFKSHYVNVNIWNNLLRQCLNFRDLEKKIENMK